MKDIFTLAKIFLISCIIAIVVILIIVGCSNEPYKAEVEQSNIQAEVEQNNERFQVVYPQISNGKRIYIIIDKETNVKYMFVEHGYAGGLTKLEE